jgi:hypothetical protein
MALKNSTTCPEEKLAVDTCFTRLKGVGLERDEEMPEI